MPHRGRGYSGSAGPGEALAIERALAAGGPIRSLTSRGYGDRRRPRSMAKVRATITLQGTADRTRGEQARSTTPRPSAAPNGKARGKVIVFPTGSSIVVGLPAARPSGDRPRSGGGAGGGGAGASPAGRAIAASMPGGETNGRSTAAPVRRMAEALKDVEVAGSREARGPDSCARLLIERLDKPARGRHLAAQHRADRISRQDLASSATPRRRGPNHDRETATITLTDSGRGASQLSASLNVINQLHSIIDDQVRVAVARAGMPGTGAGPLADPDPDPAGAFHFAGRRAGRRQPRIPSFRPAGAG